VPLPLSAENIIDVTIQQDYNTATMPIGSASINPINVDDSSTAPFFNPSSSSSYLTNSYNTPITQINNDFTSASTFASTSASASTSTSSSTIRSDRSFTNLLTESLTSSNLFHDNIDDFIQEVLTQLQLDHKASGMTVLTINNTINVVNEILEWIENIDDVELLKKPMISVITER
jgi:hypothetical protein